MNVIIPLTRINTANNDGFSYPIILTEIHGVPLLSYVIDNIRSLKNSTNIVFILSEKDCLNYKIDSVLKVLIPSCKICTIINPTKGAPCSILMSISMLDISKETLILNADQFFDLDLNQPLNEFRAKKSSAGIITFKSAHPRWSSALLEKGKFVSQISEKNPISSNAIAGFYYFETLKLFMEGAFSMIESEDLVNEQFYTSIVLNHIILQNKEVVNYSIESDKYFSFYTMNRVKEFEKNYKKHGEY